MIKPTPIVTTLLAGLLCFMTFCAYVTPSDAEVERQTYCHFNHDDNACEPTG